MSAPIGEAELLDRVSALLDDFYCKRIAALQKLELRKVLKRKNPYLYRAIGTDDAAEIVKSLLDAFISSSDETIFGNVFFEPLALWVATEANRDDPGVSVRHSSGAGADIEIETATRISLYAVKSGTSVFNSQSSKKQREEFRSIRARLHKTQKQFDPVIAYSYGTKQARPGEVRELAGSAFWAELTGEPDFYLRVIRAMTAGAAEREADFKHEYERAVNRFAFELLANFSTDEGVLDWEQLLAYNSGDAGKAMRWRTA